MTKLAKGKKVHFGLLGKPACNFGLSRIKYFTRRDFGNAVQIWDKIVASIGTVQFSLFCSYLVELNDWRVEILERTVFDNQNTAKTVCFVEYFEEISPILSVSMLIQCCSLHNHNERNCVSSSLSLAGWSSSLQGTEKSVWL